MSEKDPFDIIDMMAVQIETMAEQIEKLTEERDEHRQTLSEARASALEEASASFDYPDLRWNTAEYETLVKVQKILKARAKTERRGATS